MSNDNAPRNDHPLRRHFLTGLFVLIPIGVIVWLLRFFYQSIDRLTPDFFTPETGTPEGLALLGNLVFMGAFLLAAVMIIMALGWASEHYIGKKLLHYLGGVLSKLPLLGSIYTSLDYLLKRIASKGDSQFRRVVLFEYPRKDCWAVGFVTGPVRSNVLGPGYLNIFIPTVPNPTSGFHLMLHESEVRDSQMTVEEAFRTILSLGMAQGSKGGVTNPLAPAAPAAPDSDGKGRA